MIEPLFAYWPYLEQLTSRQVGKDVVYEHLWRKFPQHWGPVKVEGILAFDGHDVAFAHFEFDEPFGRVVLHDVSWIETNLLRAMAVRLDMLERP